MKRKLRKGEKRVEVSAIMEKCSALCTIAITPDGDTIYYRRGPQWRKVNILEWDTALAHWNYRMQQHPDRKIYRGIFTIVVTR